jgi:hypothetical protein
MEQKRRLFACLKEESSLARRMDARSRPAPRSLAEDTTRFPTGISPGDWAFSQLGQEMAQATGEIRDPHDPALLCSCSRAHYAPSFRWDERVIKRIVEMRFAPPENADRGCLGLGPCSTTCPVTKALQAAQVPLPRSSRTIWKILHSTGCLVPRSKEPPHSNELREPLEEMQMDAEGCGLRLA